MPGAETLGSQCGKFNLVLKASQGKAGQMEVLTFAAGKGKNIATKRTPLPPLLYSQGFDFMTWAAGADEAVISFVQVG